jgi:geranylgeranyl diphosphate synthase type II
MFEVAAVAGIEQSTPLEAYLDECRRLVTGEIARLFGASGRASGPLYDVILEYPLRQGKGLRPTMSIATCRALGGDIEAVLPSAATLELYHNAFLVHDDIEDESLMRRGEPTLHTTHGVPIAINVGDAMLSLSLEPLLDNIPIVGLGRALRILRAVARMTKESVEGQALELDWIRNDRWDLDDADYVSMVVKKTGWYTFIVPMQVGAIAAGVTADARLASLVPFGVALAVAFQITDDLLNLKAAPDAYGKEIGGDLWEGKRTLILLHALRTASDADHARAISILSRPRSSGASGLRATLERLEADGHLDPSAARAVDDAIGRSSIAPKTIEGVTWVFDLIQRQHSMDTAREAARAFAAQAKAELDGLEWIPPSPHREVLEDLVAYVHERAR